MKISGPLTLPLEHVALVEPLHTLNARDHVMLEVARNHYKQTSAQMHAEIQNFRQMAEDALTRKLISYGKLKNVLVPGRKRREFAFVFRKSTVKNYSKQNF